MRERERERERERVCTCFCTLHVMSNALMNYHDPFFFLCKQNVSVNWQFKKKRKRGSTEQPVESEQLCNLCQNQKIKS
jgi:hypothetical protein